MSKRNYIFFPHVTPFTNTHTHTYTESCPPKHFFQCCLSGDFPAWVTLQHSTSRLICDTNMKIITTSIHVLTDNGFPATHRAPNLASAFHWNSTETTAVLGNSSWGHTSWVSLGSRSLLNYRPHFTATDKLSRGEEEWEGMRERPREKRKKKVSKTNERGFQIKKTVQLWGRDNRWCVMLEVKGD